MSKFAAVRNLLMGSATVGAVAPVAAEPGTDAPVASTITEAQIEAVVEQESATAAAAATTAANDRWNKVMSSDEGSANPKGAAKLLMAAKGAMSADEVISALSEMGPAQAAASTRKTAAELEADRLALASDDEANPNTGGGAGASIESRRGEGDKGAAADAVAAQRAKRAAAAAAKPGFKRANG